MIKSELNVRSVLKFKAPIRPANSRGSFAKRKMMVNLIKCDMFFLTQRQPIRNIMSASLYNILYRSTNKLQMYRLMQMN